MIDISKLSGSAAKLAQYIAENSDYQFEGFSWVKSTRLLIAQNIGVNEKTVRRTLKAYPDIFRWVDRKAVDNKKYVLIRLGKEHCESDQVAFLRRTWVHRLVRFNAALKTSLEDKLLQLDSVTFSSEEKKDETKERLKKHIVRATKGAANLNKLNAGDKIPLVVEPSHMGLLRGCVQEFGLHAQPLLETLTTLEGWSDFMSIVKTEAEVERYYHWPNLKIILKYASIAMDIYLSSAQVSNKISVKDANAMLKMISK